MRQLLANMANSLVRRRLSALPHVTLARTAKLRARKVKLYANCHLTIGEGSIVEGSLVAERDGAKILIGDNTFIGNSLIASAASIQIGDDVLISWGCNIVDHNSHAVSWNKRANDVKQWYHGRKDWTDVVVSPVKINNKCWLGLNTIILKGVEVGEGAIVAAGSVVTKDVPQWTIVAGNPARVIRCLTVDEKAAADR